MKTWQIKILNQLREDGYIRDVIPLPKYNKKPTHGSCCTCQECWYSNDECVCESNRLVNIILNAEE